PYVVVRQAQLVDTDTESDLEEAPSESEESQPLGCKVPLMSEEFEASEPSWDELGKEDTEEDESSDADGEREGQSLDDEDRGLDDEGQGLAMSEPLGLGYEAAKRRALELTKEITPNHTDGRVYTNILTYAPPNAPVQTLQSPKWSLGSLPVSPSSSVVLLPIALLVA
ncbi:hypothetical protein Tco_0074744, partial [Tanacetum coccineum]